MGASFLVRELNRESADPVSAKSMPRTTANYASYMFLFQLYPYVENVHN